MKKKKIISFIVIGFCLLATAFVGSSCSSCERGCKSISSDIDGGLYRVVNVYDYRGKLIATHEGKMDIQSNESKVLFDLNGKRYIYYNAVVEVIEK